MMNFIKKHWKNILFFGLIAFMFTPAGMPLRALLIKGVSYVTSRVETLEIDKNEQIKLDNFNWQLISMDRQNINLENFQGKVILINNWATWCPPCVAEMPSLEKLYQKYKNEVVFLFVAHDKPERVRAFLANHRINIPVYYAQTQMPQILESPSIPITFIIDKSGNIIVRKTGAADWNSGQVHKILDKNIKP